MWLLNPEATLADDVYGAVVFADLAGYTALTEAHGDMGAADVAERFFELTAIALKDDGRIVKTIGDAVMVHTGEALCGLEIGLAILHLVDREPHFPGVRVGIHYGPVVERNGDVFGATVNVAARLTAQARVGQLLTTSAVAEVLSGHHHLTTTALGATWLKNVSEPVDIYWVADHTPNVVSQVLDPVCRMFVDANVAPARLPWGGQGWHFCSFECASAFSQDPDRYAVVIAPDP